MNVPAKIATAAGALVVVAGLVALTAPALAGATSPVEPTVAPSSAQAAPAWAKHSAYAEGQADYDAATAALPLPLPKGYAYPVTADWIGGPDHVGILAWDHWLAATAHAALTAEAAGNTSAVDAAQSALRSAWKLHFAAGMAQYASYLIDAVEEGNFGVILQGFPVPAGMTIPATELPEWAQGTTWLIYPDGFECVGTEGCGNDYRALIGEPGDVLPAGVEYYDPAKHDYNPETNTGQVFPAER